MYILRSKSSTGGIQAILSMQIYISFPSQGSSRISYTVWFNSHWTEQSYTKFFLKITSIVSMANTCQNHGTSNHAIPRNLPKCTVVLRKPFKSYACSQAPSIVWIATSSNFLGAVGMRWDTLWVWRGLGGALWCVSSAGGRQQSTLSKRLQVNCEVSRRAELDMWSHVVRRHMCLSSTFSKPSLLLQAHFGSVLLSLPISWMGATCSTCNWVYFWETSKRINKNQHTWTFTRSEML